MATAAPIGNLRTERLLLRQWRASDREPWAALNADPEVVRHFPRALDAAASAAVADRLEAAIAERGWGLWALEVPGEHDFVGFVGIQPVPFEAPFTPAVEVGWRLARHAWGQGWATEAAGAALDVAFDRLGEERVVAITIPDNERSLAVMRRLGMRRVPDGDFDHPALPDWDRRRHVLFEVTAAGWHCHRDQVAGRAASPEGPR